jgi:uncharacterized membrane protein
MGIFERCVKYGTERLPHCVPCAKTKEKQEAFDFLYDGAAPQESFRIPKVLSLDLYDPQVRIRLIGDLLFMDKGVCFVQIGQYETSANTTLVMFGLLGAIIGNMQEKRARKKAIEQVDIIQRTFATTKLREYLERSPRILFFPKSMISEMKFSSWSGGIKIKTTDKKQVFNLEKGKKTFREFEDKIREYQYQ